MSNENAISEFQIVPATPEMLPDILLLEEACFSSPWTRKMLETELMGNQFAHFLVATQKGQSAVGAKSSIVGYHCFWIVFEELRLMNLAVRESLRRQGIGRSLARDAFRFALDQTATRAVLEVRASNTPARSLYTQMGFVQVGQRPQYYTNPVEDAVLMELNPLVMPSGQLQVRTCRTGGESTSTDSL
ncbi:MAG: ribosomal protein S18-alanine N-acetyltransferase [Nitrospira sp.]|nr:ribosomal protein S18-alanine N-acetyltransferase [Nitrospira sp.]MDH4368310.1 ribosomal protein S18-alanine N-acetyltransferase [Nitrospira sp.]MDH5346849.1 ribosomal protein S18-alanine N-acetyltransferase [Nitrospira sp.]MDH5496277.1 ribosomal protein S18-alanine N-acetyltransferase [Nitrospira sp.]MDH5726181.1 ribosomal protein S18-alanine N-acetyltransferase [Nitrospira sp.]